MTSILHIMLVAAAAAAPPSPVGGAALGPAAYDQPARISAQSPSRVEDIASKPAKRPRSGSSGYTRWKRHLPFWPRKGWLLLELAVAITVGVVFAQILEVSGVVRYLAVLAWPVTRLGGLGKQAAPAFLMAFQSGAVANTMLVSSRDAGGIDNRQLYTSVFVVSCLSLFAHLPTYIVPIGSVLGYKATCALFAVRFVAIAAEIVVLLVVSNGLVRPWLQRKSAPATAAAIAPQPTLAPRALRKKGPFWPTVWKRSRRTLKRLFIYLVPTFAVMAVLESAGFFKYLAKALPGLFTLSFLPAESTVIIPAQAMSLYSGAAVAASCMDAGTLSAKQAVLIILAGSIITAPVRTLKHALPTYVAVLGPRAGTVMAFSAQALRSVFVIACTAAMWFIWK